MSRDGKIGVGDILVDDTNKNVGYVIVNKLENGSLIVLETINQSSMVRTLREEYCVEQNWTDVHFTKIT